MDKDKGQGTTSLPSYMAPEMPGEKLCNVISDPRLCSTPQKRKGALWHSARQRVTDSSLEYGRDSVAVQPQVRE